MIEPHRIQANTVPAALKQAQHYRLLNEPQLAESICRDIVAVEPDNELALITMLLSLTDQFDEKFGEARDQASEIRGRLPKPYHQAYYEGIILERWARAQKKLAVPVETIQAWIRNAMQSYHQASELAPADDPNPLLRWNTCARFLNELDQHKPYHATEPAIRHVHAEYGDDVPFR